MKNKKLRKFLLLPLFLVAALSFFIFLDNQDKQPIPEPTNPTVSATSEQQNILSGKTMISFGDSGTEFRHYPEITSKNTGMTVNNLGFKRTRLAYHPHSSYDEFSPTNLVDAIVSQNFSKQDTAIQEDRNYTPAFIAHYKHLKTSNFNEIDIDSLLIIGTNDYMGNQTGVVS